MKDTKNTKSILKLYITIITIVIITTTNASKIMNKSTEEQLDLENKYLRMLDFISDSRKICNRGSKSLNNYFQTGECKII